MEASTFPQSYELLVNGDNAVMNLCIYKPPHLAKTQRATALLPNPPLHSSLEFLSIFLQSHPSRLTDVKIIFLSRPIAMRFVTCSTHPSSIDLGFPTPFVGFASAIDREHASTQHLRASLFRCLWPRANDSQGPSSAIKPIAQRRPSSQRCKHRGWSRRWGRRGG